jgi:predicted DNA binding protein
MRLTVLEVTPHAGAWCVQVGQAFPRVDVTVETHFQQPDNSSIEIVRLRGPTADQAAETVGKAPGVCECEVLGRAPGEVLLRLRVRGCMLPRAVLASGVVPSQPYSATGGVHRWCVLGQGERLESFVTTLRSMGATVETVYHGEEDAQAQLTPRQRAVLRQALEDGYYDVPRRTSMTEMAAKLGVSKASLCETLQVIEKKVMQRLGGDAIVAES